MATSNDPKGLPVDDGQITKSTSPLPDSNEMPTDRFGIKATGYLARAMMAHGGYGAGQSAAAGDLKYDGCKNQPNMKVNGPNKLDTGN